MKRVPRRRARSTPNPPRRGSTPRGPAKTSPTRNGPARRNTKSVGSQPSPSAPETALTRRVALLGFCFFLERSYLLRVVPIEDSERPEFDVVTGRFSGRRFTVEPEGLEPPLAFDVAQLIATRVKGVFA